MRAEIDNQTVTTVYRRWAPVYDLVFGRVFRDARRIAIDASNRIGGRILDVGVGTGIALPYYAETTQLVGIDLSASMLARAHARVERLGLTNVESLHVMDAGELAFSDASFDAVVAQYVINTVPEPERVLDELARVLKPGGEMLLLNRVGADHGPRRAVEHWLAPVTARLGWRSEFPWARMLAWLRSAERTHGVHLIERRLMPPLNHFAFIRIGKREVTA